MYQTQFGCLVAAAIGREAFQPVPALDSVAIHRKCSSWDFQRLGPEAIPAADSFVRPLAIAREFAGPSPAARFVPVDY